MKQIWKGSTSDFYISTSKMHKCFDRNDNDWFQWKNDYVAMTTTHIIRFILLAMISLFSYSNQFKKEYSKMCVAHSTFYCSLCTHTHAQRHKNATLIYSSELEILSSSSLSSSDVSNVIPFASIHSFNGWKGSIQSVAFSDFYIKAG